jgi:BirA family biotin operon repressor/biotin-[acetyl-CoA-carboxylase] ligase
LSFSADAAPSSSPVLAGAYDGATSPDLAERLGVPDVLLFEQVSSTLDVAHHIAPGARAGTLVLAEEQTAGRGRQGRRWTSAAGAGVWLTLVERPLDSEALDVLSLRCGLYAAEALDALADAPIGVKWPNDLHVGARKLAGILIETRWRGSAPDWVAIGFGLNVVAPDLDTGVGLRAGVTRLAALERLVPALRRAAAAVGHLDEMELSRWRSRDIAADRALTAPSPGRAAGISSRGELLVADSTGFVTPHRSGSLIFADSLACS